MYMKLFFSSELQLAMNAPLPMFNMYPVPTLQRAQLLQDDCCGRQAPSQSTYRQYTCDLNYCLLHKHRAGPLWQDLS